MVVLSSNVEGLGSISKYGNTGSFLQQGTDLVNIFTVISVKHPIQTIIKARVGGSESRTHTGWGHKVAPSSPDIQD